jgi:molecular chaperone GrpE
MGLTEPEKTESIAPPEEKKLVQHEEQKLLSQDKVKELEERLLRLQADFDNYRKRAARENEAIRESSSADMLLKFLPIFDEFDIAMTHVDKADHKEFKQGIELIFSKMLDFLKKEGVEPMKALGEGFDPYKHDAIRQGEGADGKVIEVVQKGYLYNGKVLRHAKIVVGKKEGN